MGKVLSSEVSVINNELSGSIMRTNVSKELKNFQRNSPVNEACANSCDSKDKIIPSVKMLRTKEEVEEVLDKVRAARLREERQIEEAWAGVQ